MKTVNYIVVCILLIMSVVGFQAKASHTASMNLFYRHVSDSTYEFSLIFYRLCYSPLGNAPAPPTLQMMARSQHLGFDTAVATTLIQLPYVSGLLYPPVYNCTATNLNDRCYEEYEYRGLYTLPGKAPDWKFGVDHCCIPAEVDNLGASPTYIECGLNNLDFPDGNDSPLWHEHRPNRPGHTTDTIVNYPVKDLCEIQNYKIDQSAVEYEGDSLVYDVIPVYLYNSTTKAADTGLYIKNYTPTEPFPIAGNPEFSIDSSTGLIEVQPIYVDTIGMNMWQVNIKVTEYRNDTVNPSVPIIIPKEVGYTMRMMTILVQDSADCFDDFTRLIGNHWTNSQAVQCTDTIIKLNFSAKVACQSIDTNGSFLTIKNELTGVPITVNKVIPICKNGYAYSVWVHLNSPLPYGNYNTKIKQGDDGNSLLSECGYEVPYLRDSLIIVSLSNIDVELQGLPLGAGGHDSIIYTKCGQDRFDVYLSNEVQCSSIDPYGSDFRIEKVGNPSNVLTVDSVIIHGCSNSMTDHISISLSDSMPNGGLYYLISQPGIDGNVFLNGCFKPTSVDTILLETKFERLNIGSDRDYCINVPLTLDAGPNWSTYLWNTLDTTRTLSVKAGGAYRVITTSTYGCLFNDSIFVTDVTTEAKFGFQVNTDSTVVFTDSSFNALNYLWNFGDGDTSSMMNPVHLYGDTGMYQVCLTTSNACNDSTICDMINIRSMITIGVDPYNNYSFQYFPVPINDFLNIRINEGVFNGTIVVYDIRSREVFRRNVQQNNSREQSIRIPFLNMKGGIYFLKMDDGHSIRSFKVIKAN